VISGLVIDHVSLAGSMYWLIPTISFMIASLDGYAFHSFTTGLGGIVQSQSQIAAGDVSRDSFNVGQANYRSVSSGNMQFGNFSGWTTSAFNTTAWQSQVGAMTAKGDYKQWSAGRLGEMRDHGFGSSCEGDRAGYYAYQFAKLALGSDAQVRNFELDSRGGILGFTAFGRDGAKIQYKPGEGGCPGVLEITKNGKTISTIVMVV